jgi:hypothetical protein
MKKILLVLALLACATFAFADDMAPMVAATVGGSATATWGFDIANSASGFTNATSASLSFDIIPDSTVDNTSDSYPYGFISLADFGFAFNSGNDPEWLGGDSTYNAQPKLPAVTAKLWLSPALNVLISAAPTFSYSNAAGITDVTGDAAATDSVSATLANAPDGGLTINYLLGDMGATGTVSILVGSLGNWDTAANTNAYSAGVAVSLTPMDLLALSLAAGYGDFGGAGDIFFTGKVTLTPADMLSLWAAFDGMVSGGLSWDAEVAATITLTDVATITLTDYIYPGMDMDAQAKVSLSAVENLALSATADLFNILTGFDFGFQVAASYTIDSIVPGVTFTYYQSDAIGIDAYVTLGGIIANTSFKVDWATADISNDIGDLELSATITY